MVLFSGPAAGPFGFTFPFGPLYCPMLLCRTRTFITRRDIRMRICCAVAPGPPPGRIVYDDRALWPDEMCGPPSPGRESGPESHTETEPDGAAGDGAAPRRSKHDERIIVRNNDVIRIDRHDLDIRTGMDGDFRIR